LFFGASIEKKSAEKHLIICPSSLLYNWEQELTKFAPHLSSTVYHGPQRSFETISKGDQQIVITTYGTMRA
jgi:SNF2 family DNA or RNA helicase